MHLHRQELSLTQLRSSRDTSILVQKEMSTLRLKEREHSCYFSLVHATVVCLQKTHQSKQNKRIDSVIHIAQGLMQLISHEYPIMLDAVLAVSRESNSTNDILLMY